MASSLLSRQSVFFTVPVSNPFLSRLNAVMRASGLLFLCYLTLVLGVSFPLPSAEPEVGDDRGRGRGGEVEADNDNDDGPKVGNDNGRGRKDGTSDLSNARLRLPLVRPADGLDANAGGRIEVNTRRQRYLLV